MRKPILLYQTSANNIRVKITYIEEVFCLKQKAIVSLFGLESDTITII